MTMNIDSAKSYATEANLMTALAKIGLDSMKPLVVRNRAGRFTAVFGFHISGASVGGMAFAIGNAGFMVID